MRNKITITLLALVLCASAFVFPLSAYAAGGNDTTPPTLEIKKDGDKLSVAASDDTLLQALHSVFRAADGAAQRQAA